MLHKRLTVFLIISLYITAVQADPLIIGRGNDQYPPYEWIEDSKLTGIHIDLIRRAARNLDLEIQIKSYPWARGLVELEEGRLHSLTFMGKSLDREKYTLYLDGNILSESRLVLFRRIHPLPFNFDGNLTALKGKRVAVHTGYFYSDEFHSAPYFDRIEMKSYQQMLKMTYLGRTEFGIINQHELAYNFRDDPLLKEIEIISPPVSITPSYLGFSRKAEKEGIATRFADEIVALRKMGFYDELLERYGLK